MGHQYRSALLSQRLKVFLDKIEDSCPGFTCQVTQFLQFSIEKAGAMEIGIIALDKFIDPVAKHWIHIKHTAAHPFIKVLFKSGLIYFFQSVDNHPGTFFRY